MKMQSIVIGFSAMLMLSSLSVHAGPPDEAKSDSCALLKPDDLTTLLGGTPIAQPVGDACSWTASGSTKKLNILKSKNPGMASEMAFASARKNATKGGNFINERSIGDSAFARLVPFGVMLVTIKQGQMLQLQYRTEAEGTTKDLDALRPVAMKAISGF